MKEEPPFDIEKDSDKLKELVSIYDSEVFIKYIADIITLIQPPRIPYKPFAALDSPLMQLLYIGSLNITSSPDKVKKKTVNYDEWEEIIRYAVRVKAGYFDALLPEESDDEETYYEQYKIVMPVFVDFFNSGMLNYEEQEINKVYSIFSAFDRKIEDNYGLKVKDFVDIYNLLDNQIIRNANKPYELINADEETKQFWNELKENKKHPDEWVYNGKNKNIQQIVDFFKNPKQRFVIKKSELSKEFDSKKIDKFLDIFSVKRGERDNYRFYTSPILLAEKPIFNIDTEKYIITEVKQIIHAIYKELTSFLKSSEFEDRFYKRRGKFLQEKIVESLGSYFGNKANIFNEYKTSKNNKGQDVILLYKGLCLIIEAKAGREPEPRRNANVKESFKTIAQYFKKNLQKGYLQTDRVKELFDYGEDFDIISDKDKFLYHVRTEKYHSVFTFIITLDKFREPQINLNHLLELNEDDEDYPISMCLDDFEVLMLALKKKKISIQKLITFLNNRKNLQGRIDSNDELQIWADFILNDKFKIINDPNYKYSPSVFGADLFDDLYEKGLGFKNEKFKKQKENNQIISYRELRK